MTWNAMCDLILLQTPQIKEDIFSNSWLALLCTPSLYNWIWTIDSLPYRWGLEAINTLYHPHLIEVNDRKDIVLAGSASLKGQNRTFIFNKLNTVSDFYVEMALHKENVLFKEKIRHWSLSGWNVEGVPDGKGTLTDTNIRKWYYSVDKDVEPKNQSQIIHREILMQRKHDVANFTD